MANQACSRNSAYRASGDLTDPFCDPCFKDGTIRPVAGYCPKCVEFYCHGCLAAHRRMAMSECHKIMLGPDMPACQADKPVKYQLCDKHDGEGKDRYCFDHSYTVCGICFIREHKQCQVKDVSEACQSFNMSAEKKSFSADVGLLLEHVKKASQSVKSNKARLEKKKQDILTEAQKQRDKLLDRVNQGYKDFSGEVTSLFKDHIITLSARQSALDEIVLKIDTILQSLQHSGTKKQNDQKEFLELHYSAEKARLCEDKIKLLNLKHMDINCTFNIYIQPLILMKNKFGELVPKTATFQCGTELPTIHYPYKGPRQDPKRTVLESGAMGGHAVKSLKLKPLDKVNAKIPDDKEDCWMSAIDITADRNILLIDNANGRVKLFSPEGTLLSSLKPPEKPKDAAIINKSEAAISLERKQIIGIIDIADRGDISLKRIIKLGKFVSGLTAYDSNLIVTCAASPESSRLVQMIDMRGKLLWSTTLVSEDENLLDSAVFLTTCSGDDGDTVIITNEVKQTITVIDADTGKVVKVCNFTGKKPLGVTVDINGNVYVCHESGAISVWSKGMKAETCVTTGSKYLKCPLAMAYNFKRSELVLTSDACSSEYCDFIHRFKILAM